MNCWIKKDGSIKKVSLGWHAVDRERDDCIRVSMPEYRRTYAGIEILPHATSKARLKCSSIVKALHKQGIDIVGFDENSDQLAECYNHQNLRNLNKLIRG